MNVVNELIKQKFKLINIQQNEKKPPHNNWTNLSAEVLEQLQDLDSERWALFMGEHPNGRKLFCLDFDVNSAKGRCEKTYERFQEYIETNGEDGVFMGSTHENGGIIVDYTNCDGMCAMIKELCSRLSGNSYKEKLDEMEIFMGGKSILILPPTDTKCKVSGKVERKRKWLNDMPFAVLENETPDTCAMVRYFAGVMNELLQKNNKHPVRKNDEEEEEEGDEDKWIDLLMSMGNPKSQNGDHLITRTDFLKIGACLKSNKYSIDAWKRFVALDQRNGDGTKTWDSLTHPVHRNVLRTLCKKYNKDALMRWNEKYNMFLGIDILVKGMNDIATWCVPHFKDSLRCYKKLWWEYKANKGIWEINDYITNTIVSYIQQSIDETVAYYAKKKADEADEEKKKEIQKTISRCLDVRCMLCSSGSYKALEQFLRSKLYADDKWLERLDNNPYKIAYQDGILDLKTLEFREGLVSRDYLTHTLPFKFEKAKKEDKAWVKEELKKICNYKDKHLDRYLGQLGYAFCGDASKIQEFWNMKGETASNGKSTIFEVLSLIATNYVSKLNSNTFEKNMKGQIHKTIATLRGKRILWVNELDGTAIQDEAMLKNIRDGTSVPYPVMYGITASMPITGKLYLIGNEALKTKADKGIMRSLIMNQFNSNFDITNGIKKGEDNYAELMFYNDSKMIEKMIGKKHALLELIFEHSKMFADTGLLPPVPKEWRDEKEELRETLCKFDKWFADNYKWGVDIEGEGVAKAELEQHISEQKSFKIANINSELKRMKLWKNPIIYDSNKWGGGHRGVFTNIRKIEWKEKENTVI
jgi:phage/plasmid-associated DNA primase